MLLRKLPASPLISLPILPFLYHTQTILSPQNALYTNRTRRRDICFSRLKQAEVHVPWRPIATTASSTNTSGEIQHYHDDSGSPFQASKPRQSTITPHEKRVFDRIFKGLSQPVPENNVQEDEQDGHREESNPYESITSIFDAAIKEVQVREEKAAEAAAKQRRVIPVKRAIDTVATNTHEVYGRTFKRPLRLSGGIVLGVEMYDIETDQQIAQARADHQGLVERMLGGATTDVEIWQVLEREVFCLIGQLDAQIKVEDKVRKGNSNDSQKTKALTTEVTKSKALKSNTLFSILQHNYAYYVLSALRLLRMRHPSSFYALHILPAIKRLGPISYVLGASTAFYNEILFLKWTQFSDLHGMAEIMQEMTNQGLECNDVTIKLVEAVKNVRRDARQGRMGQVVQNWWGMRGTVEGFRKLRSLQGSLKQKSFHSDPNDRENEDFLVTAGIEGMNADSYSA